MGITARPSQGFLEVQPRACLRGARSRARAHEHLLLLPQSSQKRQVVPRSELGLGVDGGLGVGWRWTQPAWIPNGTSHMDPLGKGWYYWGRRREIGPGLTCMLTLWYLSRLQNRVQWPKSHNTGVMLLSTWKKEKKTLLIFFSKLWGQNGHDMEQGPH